MLLVNLDNVPRNLRVERDDSLSYDEIVEFLV